MAYQNPLLGAALGWKYTHAPGIKTESGVLVGWPAALGTFPTDAELAQCVADYQAFLSTQQAKEAGLDAAITGDSVIQQLKAMTNAEFDAWWDANVTTAAQAIAVLKRLARVIIRRVL
jgi:hypothetical protein